MNKSGKIFLVIVLLIFSVHSVLSQNLSQQADTLKSNKAISEADKEVKGKAEAGTNTRQTGTNGMSTGTQTARQVRGSRPDMSKARGARPPVIVRPSGSGIPKGAGKPGGAGRYGGR